MKSNPAIASLGLLLTAASGSSMTVRTNVSDPMRFFEGATESATTMRITMQKPFISRSVGHGRLNSDGSLELFQHVTEEGRREFDRWWRIREIAPGRFAGRMSEASGPVMIEKIGGRFRFRFQMKNNLSAEQWLTPKDDSAARTQLTIRKFGIVVAHAEGWIRKID